MQKVSVAFTFHNLSRELYCAYAYSDGVSHIESACGWLTFKLAAHKYNPGTAYTVRTLLTYSTEESQSFTRTYFTPGNHNFYKAFVACPIFELSIVTYTPSRYIEGAPRDFPLENCQVLYQYILQSVIFAPSGECSTVDFGCVWTCALVRGSMWKATNFTHFMPLSG